MPSPFNPRNHHLFQTETKARRGITLQQGSDHRQAQGAVGIQPHCRDRDMAGAIASSRRGLCLARRQLHCPGRVGMPSRGTSTAPPPCSWTRHRDAGQQGTSRAAETQGDFDVATGQSDKTGQGQGDHRQTDLLHNRPTADPLGKDPAGMLHSQPKSRAAGAAVGLGDDHSPHTGEGCPLSQRSPSHHQRGSEPGSRLGKAKPLVAGAAWSPWAYSHVAC